MAEVHVRASAQISVLVPPDHQERANGKADSSLHGSDYHKIRFHILDEKSLCI